MVVFRRSGGRLVLFFLDKYIRLVDQKVVEDILCLGLVLINGFRDFDIDEVQVG